MNAIAEPSSPFLPLWQRTRAMFARAVAAIGAPAVIAARTFIAKPLRRDIVGWLCLIENIVRKLLLAEAAVLKKAELARAEHGPRLILIPLRGMAQHWRPELQAAPARSNIHARARNIDLARPETWSARFAFAIARDPRLLPNARAPRILNPWRPYVPPPAPPKRSAPKAEDTPFRLARRLEALRRVLEDPLPHARRLAGLLSRAVRRCARVVERFAIACARSDFNDRADPRLLIEAMAKAIGCEEAFPDTS